MKNAKLILEFLLNKMNHFYLGFPASSILVCDFFMPVCQFLHIYQHGSLVVTITIWLNYNHNLINLMPIITRNTVKCTRQHDVELEPCQKQMSIVVFIVSSKNSYNSEGKVIYIKWCLFYSTLHLKWAWKKKLESSPLGCRIRLRKT